MRRLHAVDTASEPINSEDAASAPRVPERPISVHQRSAARMVRRALDASDVAISDVAVVLGVGPQRVSRLLDGEHSFPLHAIVALARTGGPRGRQVARSVADQIHAAADVSTVVPTDGSLLMRVVEISKESGEFAAAVADPDADLERVLREATDIQRVLTETIAQITARLERGQR